MYLFTDGSVNTQSKIGIGAVLTLTSLEDVNITAAKEKVLTKLFSGTSSTKLEIQTLNWALESVDPGTKVTVYTDSQNIVGLKARRAKFEKNDYKSGRGVLFNNHKAYKAFFNFSDSLDLKVIKVKGHTSSANKDAIDKAFTVVDRAARQALRLLNS